MRPALHVVAGPWLLRSPAPDLLSHRSTHGSLPALSLDELLRVVDSADLRGRGGAGFPFARKLRTVAGQRRGRHVVVNLSEGEPASLKDLALALTQPHLVLDGARAAAAALGVRTVHLVLPDEHPDVRTSMERALAERRSFDRDGRLTWRIHEAAARFVSGESSAVTELVSGRTGLPVTSWEPTAVSGVRGRPTLLSNAETFAHVAALVLHRGPAYADLGTVDEPGTRLLTLGGDTGTARVVEVAHGTAWTDVLTPEECSGPVLLGGYHGTWADPGVLRDLTVSPTDLARRGLTLGAGVVLPLPAYACPLERTASILRYLAGESAGRCGPCFNGLPALATAFEERLAGLPDTGVEQLAALVEGRGACAHPDGTVRLLRSALDCFPEELLAHTHATCLAAPRHGAVLR